MYDSTLYDGLLWLTFGIGGAVLIGGTAWQLAAAAIRRRRRRAVLARDLALTDARRAARRNPQTRLVSDNALGGQPRG